MPRGGYRENAGRRTTWTSGCRFEDTKLIRVPISISDEVMRIAHRLDSGEDLQDNLIIETIKRIVYKLIKVLDISNFANIDWRKIERILAELVSELALEVEIPELVTKSEEIIIRQLELLDKINDDIIIEPITQALLSKRLKVSTTQIRQSKGKTGNKSLQSWSPQYDPDRISWKSDSKTKKYIPANNLNTKIAQKLNQWIHNVCKQRQNLEQPK